jgi:SAM-dependent methyltransferase
MQSDVDALRNFLFGMREAYSRGENTMAWARANAAKSANSLISTLIAYDLQAGSYVAEVGSNPTYFQRWTRQLAQLLKPYLAEGDRVLEVGVGEATTLSGVLLESRFESMEVFGFDISWSRIKTAQEWLQSQKCVANLFVGDIFHIPFASNSIDIVYTSHSLEPNGGREEDAIRELLRVARKAVILVEPIYELASKAAQDRMGQNGYVRGLKATAEHLGAKVESYQLLECCNNPLNPSGVVLLTKDQAPNQYEIKSDTLWQCPLTGAPLSRDKDIFKAESVGLAYPIMRGVPLLRPDHVVVASKLLLNGN